MSPPPPPSGAVVAGSAAPAAPVTAGGPGGAGPGVAPDVGLGSSAGRRCEVWAWFLLLQQSGLSRLPIGTQAVGRAPHQMPVSLFDRSSVSPSRPGLTRAQRAAAVKTGRSVAQATARRA